MVVPNRSSRPVSVFEAIKSTVFSTARRQSKLAVPLGIGIDGNLEVLDLGKTPHLMIAGSVTSGKREFVNSVIASLALCNRPDEVQLLLDDVTRVELPSYNGLPHLVRPVVIYLEETVAALNWLDSEIIARYQKMVKANVSNIEAYNQHHREKGMMAYLVVVIYELADLMIGEPALAEPLICKLARLSPAVGIHLVVATQRPAPDVLTGALKAHFPTRICFNVVSDEDSRVVLDVGGAEKLPENGDMLFLAAGMTRLQYIKGCYISDAEIDSIVCSKRISSEQDI